MIVIPIHHIIQPVKDLLDDLRSFNIKIPISIIDTGTKFPFLEEIRESYSELNIELYTTPQRNFDTGAYMFAINNIKADRYYFLHDSLRIKTPHFFEEIDKKLCVGTVVSLTTFEKEIGYENERQRLFVLKNWDTTEFKKGIYGPMFAILRLDIEKFWSDLPKILPTNKLEQMAMERGWAVFCERNNLNIVESEENKDFRYQCKDGFTHFKKILYIRQ